MDKHYKFRSDSPLREMKEDASPTCELLLTRERFGRSCCHFSVRSQSVGSIAAVQPAKETA